MTPTKPTDGFPASTRITNSGTEICDFSAPVTITNSETEPHDFSASMTITDSGTKTYNFSMNLEAVGETLSVCGRRIAVGHISDAQLNRLIETFRKASQTLEHLRSAHMTYQDEPQQ
jgi:hypothetical protein